MAYTDADIIASLQRHNAKLRARVTYLEAQTGRLINDGDHREKSALDRAEDCTEHGRMLLHWQRLAEWHWAAAGQQENARQSIVTALILLQRDELAGRSEPVPVDVLCRWLDKACDAQKKVPRKPEGWPSLEEHLHLWCVCSEPPVAQSAEATALKAATGAGSTPARVTDA
jgi:hypothetical protein